MYAASGANIPTYALDGEGFVASPIQERIVDETEVDRSGDVLRHPTEVLRTLAEFGNHENLEVQDGVEEEYWEGEEDDESRFINYFLLSHIAVQLRDKVPRGTHVKGSIPYSRAFTGKDIVVSDDHWLNSSL